MPRILSALGVVVVVACVVGAGLWFLKPLPPGPGAIPKTPADDFPVTGGPVDGQTNPANVSGAVADPQIVAFCSGCHAFPPASSFPKDAWPREVERGFAFYRQSLRTDLTEPVQADVVQYYRSAAPAALEYAPPEQSPSPIVFRKQAVELPADHAFACVSGLDGVPGSEPPRVVFGDMAGGYVAVLTGGASLAVKRLARASHPAGLHVTDLDGDGRIDWLVADLGSFEPADHSDGRVLWLRPVSGSNSAAGSAPAFGQNPAANPNVNVFAGSFEFVELAVGLGRVADARPIDADGDGDLDVIVAEFGWLETGSVLWLQNRSLGRRSARGAPAAGTAEADTAENGAGRPARRIPVFEPHVLDRRHGSIHVPVVDLNGDGRDDFVALFSQEYESVEAFVAGDAAVGGNLGGTHPSLGDGNSEDGGGFRKELIYAAGDPAFGSSGIDVVDLDGDGDQDILFCNGDTLDSFYVKPYHGLTWLENRGEFPWTPHQLTLMPGIHRAQTADFDGDGDLDIAACAYLPEHLLRSVADRKPETLIWLEQTAPGQFERHPLEAAAVGHVALVVQDMNGDGRPDIVVGNFSNRPTADDHTWLSVWWNEGAVTESE